MQGSRSRISFQMEETLGGQATWYSEELFSKRQLWKISDDDCFSVLSCLLKRTSQYHLPLKLHGHG
jgi:hypothetical protein